MVVFLPESPFWCWTKTSFLGTIPDLPSHENGLGKFPLSGRYLRVSGGSSKILSNSPPDASFVVMSLWQDDLARNLTHFPAA